MMIVKAIFSDLVMGPLGPKRSLRGSPKWAMVRRAHEAELKNWKDRMDSKACESRIFLRPKEGATETI